MMTFKNQSVVIQLQATADLDDPIWIVQGNQFPTLEDAIHWATRSLSLTTTQPSPGTGTTPKSLSI